MGCTGTCRCDGIPRCITRLCMIPNGNGSWPMSWPFWLEPLRRPCRNAILRPPDMPFRRGFRARRLPPSLLRGLMTEPTSSAENQNPPEEGGSVPPPVELPDAALQRVTEELAALKDKYLRSAAEFENFRKRTAKERVEVWAKAQGELIERLVDGLDDLNRFAEVDQATTDTKTLHDGVELVRRKFWKVLDAVGLVRID